MSARPDGRPVDLDGQPIEPRAQPGYYAGFSTLAQQAFWDDATRKTVLARVHDVPPIRFFSEHEATLLAAVADRLVPQDDRDADHRIPIVPFIDERLYLGRIDGYRYVGMPPDGEAHQLGLAGIEAVAHSLFSRSFLDLTANEQEATLQTLHDGKPPAGERVWKLMDVNRYWMLVLNDVCHVYYAHPWAWDEIGFGGPAYPRGYMRLERGEPEPWEVHEQRYEWRAPPGSVSGTDAPAGGAPYGSPGQGGTH
ncbi:MAG: gluconate 2-dehydrogenase subunit 3 family protein [Deltaproteobacteria bacterium]